MSDELISWGFEDDPYRDYPEDMDERTDADQAGRFTGQPINVEPKPKPKEDKG